MVQTSPSISEVHQPYMGEGGCTDVILQFGDAPNIVLQIDTLQCIIYKSVSLKLQLHCNGGVCTARGLSATPTYRLTVMSHR